MEDQGPYRRNSAFKSRRKSNRHPAQKSVLQVIGGMDNRVHKFVERHANLEENTVILRTRSQETIRNLTSQPAAIVNLKRLNEIRRINKFLEEANAHLKADSVFIGCAEVSEQRKKRIYSHYPRILGTLVYSFDFILRRMLPKLTWSRGIYFIMTDGRNRVLSKAELLGRLICCGFSIVELKEIDGILYFAVKKSKEPTYDLNPSYGPLFKMKRTGKNGKIIYVYKFRTMHPYSEYVQDYIIRKNGYKEIGKPADDFRITTWGKFLRRYWLDELPQLINVLKGEMKLVGIRPISNRFLNEFPEDVRQLRMKQKPGCIPAYVSLLKQSVTGFIEAESMYLREKEKHPYLTDIKYFLKAIFNIATNKIRSA